MSSNGKYIAIPQIKRVLLLSLNFITLSGKAKKRSIA